MTIHYRVSNGSWRLGAALLLALLTAMWPASAALADGPAAALEFEVDADVSTELELLAGAAADWRLEAAGPAAHGTVAVLAAGTVAYTPDPGFTGVDAFTFTVTGPGGERAEGEVTVFVFAETVFAPEPPGGGAAETGHDPAKQGPAVPADAVARDAASGGLFSGLHPWRHVIRIGLVAIVVLLLLLRKKAPAA